MAVAANEVKKLALKLPDKQRAGLVASLLASLPSVLTDEDKGMPEALKRDAELESGIAQPLSLDQLDAEIRKRRR